VTRILASEVRKRRKSTTQDQDGINIDTRELARNGQG
jgi:hypothetical protein